MAAGVGRVATSRGHAFVVDEARRPSLLGGAIRGAIAGAVATWLMDLTTTGLVQGESDEDKRREAAAQPNGQSSVANMVDRLEGQTGLRVSDSARSTVLNLVHYCLGVVPGAIYGALRRRVPAIAVGGGLLYGVLLFVANDEVVNTELGFAGPYQAYPLASHVRGIVGHAVLGVATDRTLDLLGG